LEPAAARREIANLRFEISDEERKGKSKSLADIRKERGWVRDDNS
jgi:hypothetical protein